MVHKSKTQMMDTYNAIAEHFDKTRYKPWPETVRYSESLNENALILDVGCGNGRNSRFLASKGLRVIGVDISRTLVRLADHRGKEEMPGSDIQFSIGDAVLLPFKPDTIDAVVFIATLHHLTSAEERLRAMKEIHSILKPGGTCLVSAWAREQEKFEDELENARSLIGNGWEPGDILLPWHRPDGKVFLRYYHLFSKDEFRELIDNTDFTSRDIWESCDNHYARLKK